MLSSSNGQKLKGLSTALVADARVRLDLPQTHLDPEIRPVIPFSMMVGTAVTVQTQIAGDPSSADLSLYHQAMARDDQQEDKILIIQVPSALNRYSIFGSGAATTCLAHGIVGVVIEGSVRDTPELNEMGFCAFARSLAPGFIAGKVTATAIDQPVVVGGTTIHSGDLIVADHDGVAVIRPHELDDVLRRAEAIQQWESQIHAAMAKGASSQEAVDQVGQMP